MTGGDPFRHLLAVEYHRHIGRVYVKAWDEYSQNLVVYAVTNCYHRVLDWRLFMEAKTVADAEKCIDELSGHKHDFEYQHGLLYVSCIGSTCDKLWPMGVHQISAVDYAAIVALAGGRV